MNRGSARMERTYSALYRDIWKVVRRIPRGKVATYGQVSALAGRPGQPRLVGYALHRLPADSPVPWHRVINARGQVSTRSASSSGYAEPLQQAMLRREGIFFDSHGRLDLDEYRWKPRRLIPLGGGRRTGPEGSIPHRSRPRF